ncbi:SCYL2, partial [Cordylochernes scorpioides]
MYVFPVTMEVLNKIKSTVSTLSTVLPGNPVTREYEVGSLVASAGPGLLWKVYQATKKSTKQEAAVFVLEKKALERFSRRDKEQLLDIFKKGVAQLTRLRHPSVLTVQHPLEESRESLAFATEPVFASLANILDPGASLPSPSSELQGYRLHDIEVKYGLLQLAEGLAFLHNDVKLIHGNLCPQSILVNKNGAWKLAGFDFSRSNSQNGVNGVPDPDSHPFARPDLDFLAPEGTKGPPSDMFSLGQLELKYFDDLGVKTLQYLDSLYQWDNLQKSQFFKGLPQVIIQTPKILLIFMQKMELLLTKCPPDVIRNHVLPMIYNALESDAQQIQELCLNIIPSFANLIEYPAMKNALLPRIKKLCLNTAFLSVRVNCLVCLGKLLEHLDKWLVLDEVLPFLPQVPSREPAVLMAILGIYKLTMNHKKLGITKDVMATKVIPFLMPLTIENGLTLNQFTSLMTVVKEMVAQVETEHRAKLEQLNSLRKEHQSTLDMVNTRETPLVQAPPPKDNKK